MMTKLSLTNFTLFLLLLAAPVFGQTYAEKLGFPKGARVLILHVDDAGMSWDSNKGAIRALEEGVATSLSVMMPCPWVPGIVHYIKTHPKVDAGLHLTLNSEWEEYRWGPLAGKPAVAGLVDKEGAMWPEVEDVVAHASADEVEKEIRAQVERALEMGFQPTHLDSHMGTLFATPEYLMRYIKVGAEYGIPVMFPGGAMNSIAMSRGISDNDKAQFQEIGKQIWNSGFPVLDDLHNLSYGFKYGVPKTEEDLQKEATAYYMETIRSLEPGLSMVIMHCTNPSDVFQYISYSGLIRKADMLTMINPKFKSFLESEGIVLTTWREVMERRKKIK